MPQILELEGHVEISKAPPALGEEVLSVDVLSLPKWEVLATLPYSPRRK